MMRPKPYYPFLVVVLVLAVAPLSGCGGGGGGSGSPPSVGSGSQTFAIYTHTSNGDWTNAVLQGQADPTNIPCNPLTDTGCLVSFPATSTGSGNELLVHTNALPTNWEVVAAGNENPGCGAGANSGWVSESNDGPPIELYCGQTDPVGGSVGPSECTVTYVNQQLYQDCPSIVQMIANGDTNFPTTYALHVDFYDVLGNWEGGEQATAQTSTTLNFAAPTNWGTNVVTVTDPTTNMVLAGAGYTLHRCDVTVNPPYSDTYCPY